MDPARPPCSESSLDRVCRPGSEGAALRGCRWRRCTGSCWRTATRWASVWAGRGGILWRRRALGPPPPPPGRTSATSSDSRPSSAKTISHYFSNCTTPIVFASPMYTSQSDAQYLQCKFLRQVREWREWRCHELEHITGRMRACVLCERARRDAAAGAS